MEKGGNGLHRFVPSFLRFVMKNDKIETSIQVYGIFNQYKGQTDLL